MITPPYHRLPREAIYRHILPWLYIIDPLNGLRVTGHILYREHDLLIKASLATPDMYERYLFTDVLPLCGRTIRACVDNECFSLVNKLIDAPYDPCVESAVDWFYVNRRYLDLIPENFLRKIHTTDKPKEVLVSLYILRLLEGHDSWVSKTQELFSKPDALEHVYLEIAQSPYDKDIIEHIDPSVWEQATPTLHVAGSAYFFTVRDKQIYYGDQVLTSDQFVEYCRTDPCSTSAITYSVWKDILRYKLVPPEQAYASIFSSLYLSFLFIPLLVDVLQDIDLCNRINDEIVDRMGDAGFVYIEVDPWHPVDPAQYYLAFFMVLNWFEKNHKDRCPGLRAFRNLLEELYNRYGSLRSSDYYTSTLDENILPKLNKLEFEQLKSVAVPWLNPSLLEKSVYEVLHTLQIDELGNEEDNYKLLCERADMSVETIKYIVDILWW